MAKATQKMSLHSRLVRSIMALSTITLLIAAISIINMVDKEGDETIASETRAWANILAKNSSRFLESDNDVSQVKLKEELKELITTPIINHIHVYRLNEDGSVEYFTSYNKNHRFPAIEYHSIPK